MNSATDQVSDKVEKPKYYIIWQLGAGVVFALVGSPFCILLFITAFLAACFKFKNTVDNFDWTGPSGSYSAKTTADEPLLNHDMYTTDCWSTSPTSGANFSVNRDLFGS